MKSENKQTSWDKVRRSHPKVFEGYTDLLDSLGDLGAEKVVSVKAPYGQKIIKDGSFAWQDLLTQDDLEFLDYPKDIGDGLPIGLVVDKAIELFHLLPIRYDEDGPKSRSTPIYYLRPGDFFGLFENLLPDFQQIDLQARAGATSLLSLLPLGDANKARPYLTAISKTDERLKASLTDSYTTFQPDLKDGTNSRLMYGLYFAELLFHMKKKWECEILVFSSKFLERAASIPGLTSKIYKQALSQMHTLNRRISSMNEEYRLVTKERTKIPDAHHRLAVSSINAGGRLGLIPMNKGYNLNEELMPFSIIDTLLKSGNRPLIHPSAQFWLLRPALHGEPALYFLRRPLLSPLTEATGNAKTMTSLTSSLKKEFLTMGYQPIDANSYLEFCNKFYVESATKDCAPYKKSHYFKSAFLSTIGNDAST